MSGSPSLVFDRLAIADEKRPHGRLRYIEFETPRAKQEPRLHAAALCREIA